MSDWDWDAYIPAVDEGVDDAVLVSLCQWRVADSAAEAVDVKNKISGAHDQLVGADGGQAARASASTKKTVSDNVGCLMS